MAEAPTLTKTVDQSQIIPFYEKIGYSLGDSAASLMKTDGTPATGMMIWAMVTNTLLMTLYSSNNMPYAALGGVMSADISERNKLNAYRFAAVMLAQWVVVTFTLVLRDKIAGPH